MTNLPVISLNTGKVTPLIDVRSDIEKYSSACRILDNMIPRIYGPVERRPGTKKIADVKIQGTKSRMVSFIFSSSIAYQIEFTNKLMVVYFGDELIEDNIDTPYSKDDLFQLQFKQSADVMWITHPSYAPRKLTRTTATEFSLDTITFDSGPFIERNDIAEEDDVTMTIDGLDVATATAGAAGEGSFTISGTSALLTLFPANKRFYITGFTGNDKAYTVHATTATTHSGSTLTVFTNEAIVDGADDGEIMVDGATATLTASSGTFVTGDSGHDGTLFKITHKRLQTVTKGTATATGVIGEAIDVKGQWTFNTGGNWDATVEIQRNEDGTNWETFRTYISTITSGSGSRNIQKSDTERADGVQYRINVTEFTSGSIEADFSVDASTQDSIFRITDTRSTTVATATTVVAAPDNVASKRWAEGSWSAVRGYPKSITFFEERAVYGFTTMDNRNIWLSKSGDFENFDSGVLDNDSFALTLPTTDAGQWLASLEVLAAGTAGNEWRIRSSALDEALTPTNFSMKDQTKRGSANIQAIEVNEAILFIDSVSRKIREYTFSGDKQKYVSPDLTALAEDITKGGITSLAIQKNPDSIIWFTINNSPYLISMSYEREQNVIAFANHPLGGEGMVESVCVTPSSDEDLITLTVKRVINGFDVRFIEQMQPRDWGDDDNDAFFVDAGTTFDVAEATDISYIGYAVRYGECTYGIGPYGGIA